MSGLDRVPRVSGRTASVMRLDPIRRLLLMRLPAAAPHLVTGIKLAVAYSVIGIVAGEFILATAGIGKRIAFGYQDFDNKTMYGMLLLLLLLVTAVNGALSRWEKRLHHRFGRQ
jgi:NitT/TauT family transport system permease protein